MQRRELLLGLLMWLVRLRRLLLLCVVTEIEEGIRLLLEEVY